MCAGTMSSRIPSKLNATIKKRTVNHSYFLETQRGIAWCLFQTSVLVSSFAYCSNLYILFILRKILSYTNFHLAYSFPVPLPNFSSALDISLGSLGMFKTPWACYRLWVRTSCNTACFSLISHSWLLLLLARKR